MNLRIEVPNRRILKEIDNRWSEVKMNNSFTPRCAFAFCSQGDIGYLHGGYNTDRGALGDMYMGKFNDPDDKQWHLIEQKGKELPGKIRYHTMCSYLCYLLLIGGQKSMMENNSDIFYFNLKTKIWKKVIVNPEGKLTKVECNSLLNRESHCSFVYKNYIYIFGGYLPEHGEHSNHVLKINLANIEKGEVSMKLIEFEASVEVPLPRSNFAICTLNSEAFIFGGSNSVEFYDDFWKFDCEKEKWEMIKSSKTEQSYWPEVSNIEFEKRKGAALVAHEQSQSIILFGGMQQVTKELNDLSIYLTKQNKWVKVHSTTNNIYDPSPTIKQQVENSPTIISHKYKRPQKEEFKLGIMNVTCVEEKKDEREGKGFFVRNKSKTVYESKKSDFNKKARHTRSSFMSQGKQSRENYSMNLEAQNKNNKMSVVQEKKYRQFLLRKKKLMSEIFLPGAVPAKRRFSPTSECINYTLNQLGEQSAFDETKNPEFQIPKVIFDDKKSEVIGKKPCARDGHAAFSFGQNMYIIGGDRHTVSFNDTHLLRMDKAIESLNYYA